MEVRKCSVHPPVDFCKNVSIAEVDWIDDVRCIGSLPYIDQLVMYQVCEGNT